MNRPREESSSDEEREENKSIFSEKTVKLVEMELSSLNETGDDYLNDYNWSSLKTQVDVGKAEDTLNKMKLRGLPSLKIDELMNGGNE